MKKNFKRKTCLITSGKLLKKSLFFLLSAFLVLSCQLSGGIGNDAPAPVSFDMDDSHAFSRGTASITTNSLQQNIRGFGGANILGDGWRPDMTSADRTKAFSVENGLGFSVLRVRVSPDTSEWAANRATIDAARSYGAMVVASTWSAPAFMKTNNNLTGGTLKTGSYADYATHLRNFCNTVGGVDAISPINEPNISVSYESMEMTASEVAAFVAAQGGNCGAPIMAPEPFNMDQGYINQYLGNSTARANTAYVAGHIYGATPSYFNPGREVWMTEHYVDSNTDGNDWNKSMNVAKELHDCMNAGYSMYVWWYIKRYYGPIDEDGNITKTGYVMSHYARWVRPGFHKISCTANPTSNVYSTAYKKDSTVVIVAINRNSSSTSQAFSFSDMSVSSIDYWTTTSSANQSHGAISASGSGFSMNLPASSITTFVLGGSGSTAAPTPVPTPTSTSGGNSRLDVELESLSGQAVFSPFAVQNDSAASGGQYIVWPNNGSNQINSSASDSTTGQAACTFTLSQTANVTFEIRADMPNGNDDSFYYKMDSGSWNTQNNMSTSGWQTVNIATFNNLAAGSHTLIIERREDGAKLDKITLTASTGTIGSGTATSPPTLPPTPGPTRTPTPTSTASGSNVLEVELESLSNQSLFSPLAVTDDSAASGGQAIQWPDNGNQYLSTASDTATGQVQISFTLTQTANVQFQIRVNLSNASNDSFYYKMDANSWSTQNNQTTSGYAVLSAATYNNLSAGTHTLRILRREDGALLDKVTLTASAGSIY